MYCHGPITLGYESGWEDVWATLFIGRRKRKTFGPCIVSLSSLEFDISVQESMIAKRRERDTQQFYDLQAIRNRLLSGERFIADRKPGDGRWGDGDSKDLPNIYVAEQSISKANAEEAVWWWLLECGYVSTGVEPRFHWNRPGFIIVPVG